MMATKSVIRTISVVIFILCRLYIFSVECKWIPPCQKVVNGEIDSVPASSDSIYLTRDLNDCNCGPDSEMSQIGYILVPVSYLTAGDENAENLKAILMDNAIHKKHQNELAPDGPSVQEVPFIRDGPPVQVVPLIPDEPPVQDKNQVEDEPQPIEQNNDGGNVDLENNSEINPNTSLETPETTMVKIDDSINEDPEKDDEIPDEINPFYKKVQDIFTSWGNNGNSSLDSDDDVVKLLTDNSNTSTPVNQTPDDQSEDNEDLENRNLSLDDLVGDDGDKKKGDGDASNGDNSETDQNDDEDTPAYDDQDTDSEEDEDLAKVDLSDDDLNIDDDEDEDDDDKDDNVKIAPDDANIKRQEDLAKYKLDMCSNIVSYQTKLLDHVLRYMDYIKEKIDQQKPPTPVVPIFNQGVIYPSYNQNYVQPDHHHHLGHEQNPSLQHYTLPSAPFKPAI